MQFDFLISFSQVQFNTRKVAEVRLWVLLLGHEIKDNEAWPIRSYLPETLTSPIRFQYVLANEKMLTRHCQTTL